MASVRTSIWLTSGGDDGDNEGVAHLQCQYYFMRLSTERERDAIYLSRCRCRLPEGFGGSQLAESMDIVGRFARPLA